MISLAEMSRQTSARDQRPASLVKATVNLSAFPVENLSGQRYTEFNIPSASAGEDALLGSGKETVDFGAYIAALEDLVPAHRDETKKAMEDLFPPTASQEPALMNEGAPEKEQTSQEDSAFAMEDEFALPSPLEDEARRGEMPPSLPLPERAPLPTSPDEPPVERATTAFPVFDPATALENVGLFADFEEELPELPELPEIEESHQTMAPQVDFQPALEETTDDPDHDGFSMDELDFLGEAPTSEPSRPTRPPVRAVSASSASHSAFDTRNHPVSSRSSSNLDSASSGREFSTVRPSYPRRSSFPSQPSMQSMEPRVTQRGKTVDPPRPPEEFLGPQERKRPLQKKSAPPLQEKATKTVPVFEDLLQDFMETELKDDMSQYHYKLQMNGKTFQHLKEEDILSLLESRQLTGEEKASLQLKNEWKPLKEISDFRPTILLMQSEKKFKAHTKPRSAPQKSAPEIPSVPTEAQEPKPPAVASPEKEEEAPAPTEKRSSPTIEKVRSLNSSLGTITLWRFQVPVLYLAAGLCLLTLLLLLPGLFEEGSNSRKVTSIAKDNRKAITVLSGFPMGRALSNSRYRKFMFALNELKKAGRDATQSSLRKIRAAYYLLDQFGQDAPIADDAELIANRFLKKATFVEKIRIKVLQTITQAKFQAKPVTKKRWLKHLPPKHREWGYVRGRLLERAGDLQEAKQQYRKFLKRHKSHIPALLALGGLLYKGGDETTSMLLYKKVLKRSPRHVGALLTVTEYSQDNPIWKRLLPKSREVLDRLVKQGITSACTARWHYIAALRYWRRAQFLPALKKLNEAYTYDRNNRHIRLDRIRYHLWAGKHSFAKRILKEELSNSPKNSYLKLLQVEINIRLRQFRTASYQLRQLLKKSRTRMLSSQLYFLQGQLNETRGKVKRAIRSYKSSVKSMGKGRLYPGIKALLSLLLIQQKPQEVLDTLRRVTRSSKKMRPYFRYIKARAYLQQGRTQEANIASESLRSKYPRWSRGFELEGRIKLSTGSPWQAMTWFRRAAAKQARNPLELRFLMSYILLKKGDFSDVILLQQRQQREKQSQIPNICYSLGLQTFSLFAQRQCSQLRKLPLRSAYCPEPYLVQARCALKNANRRRAMTYLRKAVRLAPGSLEPLWQLGQLYIRSKQWGKLRPSSLVALRAHPKRNQLVTRLLLSIPANQSRRALRFARSWRDPAQFYLPLELEAIRLEVQLRGQKRARKAIKKLLNKLPSTEAKAKFLATLAARLVQRKLIKPAITYYAKALIMLPTSSPWRLEVAELYAKTGNLTYCRQELRNYLQTIPEAARPKGRVAALRKQCKYR